MTRGPFEAAFAAPAHHWLLDNLPISRRFSVSPAAVEDLPFLMALTARHIPGLTGALDAARRAHDHSASILAVRDQRGLVGSYAFLFLNRNGLEALLDGDFPIASPDTRLLAGAQEQAAALYAWAMCLPGPVVGAMGNIMALLRRPAHARADLYARPATPKGEQFMIKTGFRPLADARTAPALWAYRRVTPVEQAAA